MAEDVLIEELSRGNCFADSTPLGFNTLLQGAAHLGRLTGFACKSFKQPWVSVCQLPEFLFTKSGMTRSLPRAAAVMALEWTAPTGASR